MRYWVVSVSVLMGVISLARTGDPSRVVSAIAIGAVIGVILYGLFVALTSATSSVNQFLNTKGVRMKKFIWAVIYFAAVIVQAIQTSFMYALGATLPWFILGLLFSPIWWGVTKKYRQSPWKWFDWLNAGSYIMLVLFVLRLIVKEYMSSKGIGY